MNRYYSSGLGRFTSPDPQMAGATESDPTSWNQYGYTTGDPISFHDPSGLLAQAPGYCPPEYSLYECDAFGFTRGGPNDGGVGGGGGGYGLNCVGSRFVRVPFCLIPIIAFVPPPAEPERARLPSALRVLGTICSYPSGTSITQTFTTVVTYQVVDQFGVPIRGNSTLAAVRVTETIFTSLSLDRRLLLDPVGR